MAPIQKALFRKGSLIRFLGWGWEAQKERNQGRHHRGVGTYPGFWRMSRNSQNREGTQHQVSFAGQLELLPSFQTLVYVVDSEMVREQSSPPAIAYTVTSTLNKSWCVLSVENGRNNSVQILKLALCHVRLGLLDGLLWGKPATMPQGHSSSPVETLTQRGTDLLALWGSHTGRRASSPVKPSDDANLEPANLWLDPKHQGADVSHLAGPNSWPMDIMK